MQMKEKRVFFTHAKGVTNLLRRILACACRMRAMIRFAAKCGTRVLPMHEDPPKKLGRSVIV